MLKMIPLLCLTLAATPALAAATPWQDLAPGVRARVISADTLSNGPREGATLMPKQLAL